MSDKEPVIAVRLGDVDESGAYFALPGSSTYFDPTDAKRSCYDLSAVRILDWRDPILAMQLLVKTRELLTAETSTPRGVDLLNAAIEEVEQGEPPHVDYFLADEAPMANAARSLGYGALLVFENDDWVTPSSVFVTNAAISNVRKLTAGERKQFIAKLQSPEVEPQSEAIDKIESRGR